MFDLSTVLPYLCATFIAYEVISTIWRKYVQYRENRRIDNIQNIMASVYASFIQMALRNEYQPIDDSVRVRLNDLLNKNLSVELWRLINTVLEAFTKRYFKKNDVLQHIPDRNYQWHDFGEINRPHVIGNNIGNPYMYNLRPGAQFDYVRHVYDNMAVPDMAVVDNGVCTCGQPSDEDHYDEIQVIASKVDVPQNDNQEESTTDEESDINADTPTETPTEQPTETTSEQPAKTPTETPANGIPPAFLEGLGDLPMGRLHNTQQIPRFGARRFATGAAGVIDHPLKTTNVPPPTNN